MRGQRQDSLAGTPQGGIVSPILMNVYLHELDNKVEELRQRYASGKRKRRNPEYRNLAARKERLARQGKTKSKEFRQLVQQIRTTPSVDTQDPNFIRIKYVRYADDWLIGLCGPRTLAEKVKEEIRIFLDEHLHLTLSESKTHITHARSEPAYFLGTLISIGRGGKQRVTKVTNGHKKPMKRRTTGSEVVMKLPVNHLIQRLHNRGFCTTTGDSTTKLGWTNLDPEQIVSLFNGMNRGIQNYYRFVDNINSLARIQHILRFSLARTLAAKYKISVKQVFRRFGRNTTIIVRARDGKKDRYVSYYLNSDWTMKRNAFQTNDDKADLVQMMIRMRSRSKLGKPCCICNSCEQVEMHHVRHIRKVKGKKATGFKAIMSALNRKQIPTCKTCHRKIHRGEYDGISLKDLAYDPR